MNLSLDATQPHSHLAYGSGPYGNLADNQKGVAPIGSESATKRTKSVAFSLSEPDPVSPSFEDDGEGEIEVEGEQHHEKIHYKILNKLEKSGNKCKDKTFKKTCKKRA